MFTLILFYVSVHGAAMTTVPSFKSLFDCQNAGAGVIMNFKSNNDPSEIMKYACVATK